MELDVLPSEAVEPEKLSRFVIKTWHSDVVVAHGDRIHLTGLPGYVALDGYRIVGHASYRISDGSCELTSIAADPQGQGIGSRLMDAVVEAAQRSGCHRVWLTTTNDNLDALRFYQRRGYRLTELRLGAVDRARAALKPEIPDIGSYGIPMHDEIDLELTF